MIRTRFRVVADDTAWSETFEVWGDALGWLRLVRMEFGCNACLVEVRG